MAKRYKFVRLDNETYEMYKRIQEKMQKDLYEWSGKEVTIPLTRIFNALIKYNENCIEIDLKNILRLKK